MRFQDFVSIGITDNRDCLKRSILESFFSDLICSSVTGLLKELKYFTSTATNFFVESVGSV